MNPSNKTLSVFLLWLHVTSFHSWLQELYWKGAFSVAGGLTQDARHAKSDTKRCIPETLSKMEEKSNFVYIISNYTKGQNSNDLAIWVLTSLQSYSWNFLSRPHTYWNRVCAMVCSNQLQVHTKRLQTLQIFKRAFCPHFRPWRWRQQFPPKVGTQSHCSRPQSWYHDKNLESHITKQVLQLFSIPTRCYRKVPGLLLLYRPWWKKMIGEAKSHFHKPIASVCHVTPRCDDALFLHECFFNFVFRSVTDGWQNRATCLHQVLHEAR
jgi:hypothetical protein